MEVRVEDDVRAVPHGPADRFRIAPAFMADRDAKRQRTGLEYPPSRPERIDSFLGRIDLDFVLEAGDGSICIDDQRSGEQVVAGNAFGAENHCDLCRRSGRRDDRPRAFEECRVGRRHHLAQSPVARNEAFRKADDARAFDRCLRDGVFG